jgi:hypothetical protein
MRSIKIPFTIAIVVSFAAPVRAEIIEFRHKAEWEGDVGEFTTIDFTGFDQLTIITDQYADLGILFTDGSDWIIFDGDFEDGSGLSGGFGDDIEISFDEMQHWIAIDFVGIAQIELYRDGELIETSSIYDDTVSTFGGLISSEPFDAAVIDDPSASFITIDNLHFGPPIPTPGVLVLVGLGVLGACDRRRRRRLVGGGR